jgi:hypothetical protein
MTTDSMGTAPIETMSVYCTTHARYFEWDPAWKVWACPQAPIRHEILSTNAGVFPYEKCGEEKA